MNLSTITKASTLVLCTCIFQIEIEAQTVLDPKAPPSYAPVRHGDVMWMKRVWRRIDLRQKMNHHLYFPERPANGLMSLYDHLIMAIESGEITAFDPGPLGDNDMFTDPMSIVEVMDKIRSVDTVYTTDPLTFEDSPTIVTTETRSSDVVMYELKEEWFFDKQRSVMDVRITGICPLVRVEDELTGEFRGFKRLFWIYLPEARYELANSVSFNRRNTAEQRSFDEVFQKRMFDSYIIKESNVYNRSIAEYAQGKDALLEAERIEHSIFEMEHDLWSH